MSVPTPSEAQALNLSQHVGRRRPGEIGRSWVHWTCHWQLARLWGAGGHVIWRRQRAAVRDWAVLALVTRDLRFEIGWLTTVIRHLGQICWLILGAEEAARRSYCFAVCRWERSWDFGSPDAGSRDYRWVWKFGCSGMAPFLRHRMSLPESAFPVQVYTPPSSSDPFSNFKLPVMACAVLLLLGYGLGWVAQCAIEALCLCPTWRWEWDFNQRPIMRPVTSFMILDN